MKTLIAIIPAIILIAVILCLPCIVDFLKQKVKKRKNPLTIKILRAPGESLLREINELKIDYSCTVFIIIIIPLFFISIHLSDSYISGTPETISRYIINSLATIGMMGYFVYKLFNILKEIENKRLGYDAERATGQELNKLLSLGYKVFHDIPGNKFNIDHIFIGKNGVFAVETKGRSKSLTGKGKDNATVVYDGESLQFPSWKETEPIIQVKSSSRWLSTELSSAVGEDISVVPVLSIVGWFIDRRIRAKVYVYNGKSPENIFPQLREQELSEQLIGKIAHQVERMVNDVKPMAY